MILVIKTSNLHSESSQKEHTSSYEKNKFWDVIYIQQGDYR